VRAKLYVRNRQEFRSSRRPDLAHVERKTPWRNWIAEGPGRNTGLARRKQDEPERGRKNISPAAMQSSRWASCRVAIGGASSGFVADAWDERANDQ
jgi:hypothetical protein